MARYFPFHRGVDNEIEFKGLRGAYFYWAAGVVVGAILLSMFLYIVGFPMVLTIFLLVAGGGGGLYYIMAQNTKYGRYGKLRKSLPAMRPRSVVINHATFRFITKSNALRR